MTAHYGIGGSTIYSESTSNESLGQNNNNNTPHHCIGINGYCVISRTFIPVAIILASTFLLGLVLVIYIIKVSFMKFILFKDDLWNKGYMRARFCDRRIWDQIKDYLSKVSHNRFVEIDALKIQPSFHDVWTVMINLSCDSSPLSLPRFPSAIAISHLRMPCVYPNAKNPHNSECTHLYNVYTLFPPPLNSTQ